MTLRLLGGLPRSAAASSTSCATMTRAAGCRWAALGRLQTATPQTGIEETMSTSRPWHSICLKHLPPRAKAVIQQAAREARESEVREEAKPDSPRPLASRDLV